jgi:hypothetical protein
MEGAGLLYSIIGILAGVVIKNIFFPEDVFNDIAIRAGTKKPLKKEIEKDFMPVDYEPVVREKARAKERIGPVKYEKSKPSKPNALISWFAENTLAKVG